MADALRSDRDEGIRGLQEQQREEAGEEQGEVAQVAVSTDTGEDEDVERLRQENEDLRQRVAVADRRLEAAAAAQLARIASLEKTNRQLSWQVAMTTASSGQAMPLSGLEEGRPRPAPVLQAAASSGSAPSGISLASVVGWVLAHRKLLVAAYLVILHLMVYFALTHGAFSFSTYANKPTCEAPPPALLAMAPGSVSVSQLPPPSNAARPPFLADLGTVDELIRAAEKIDRAKPADPALEVSGSGRGGGGGGAVAGEASAVNQDNPSNPEAEVQQAQRQGADHMAGKGAAQGGAVEAQGKAA